MKDTTTTAASASSSSSSLEDPNPRAIHEKRVRIMPPQEEEEATTTPPRFGLQEEEEEATAAAFAAFYRVVQDQGASVYNNGESVSFDIRAECPLGSSFWGGNRHGGIVREKNGSCCACPMDGFVRTTSNGLLPCRATNNTVGERKMNEEDSRIEAENRRTV
jgi:hypothetical protein